MLLLPVESMDREDAVLTGMKPPNKVLYVTKIYFPRVKMREKGSELNLGLLGSRCSVPESVAASSRPLLAADCR